VAHLDPSALQFDGQSNQSVASTVVGVLYLEHNNRVVRRVTNTVPLSFTDDDLRTFAETGTTMTLNAHSMSAVTSVKVLIYQYATDRIGRAVATIR
jgi:hypothetical protein